MNDHQIRILVRMADLIERSRAEDSGMVNLLNDLWAMFEAAEIRELAVRTRFEDLYYRMSAADDARQPSIPSELELDRDVEAAMDALYAWLRSLVASEDGTAYVT